MLSGVTTYIEPRRRARPRRGATGAAPRGGRHDGCGAPRGDLPARPGARRARSRARRPRRATGAEPARSPRRPLRHAPARRGRGVPVGAAGPGHPGPHDRPVRPAARRGLPRDRGPAPRGERTGGGRRPVAGGGAAARHTRVRGGPVVPGPARGPRGRRLLRRDDRGAQGQPSRLRHLHRHGHDARRTARCARRRRCATRCCSPTPSPTCGSPRSRRGPAAPSTANRCSDAPAGRPVQLLPVDRMPLTERRKPNRPALRAAALDQVRSASSG